MHIPELNLYNMACTGFCDALRDIQDPPPALVPPSPPDPHDEEMDARPDQEEMEEAINNFLQQLDKQERRASRTWPTCCLCCPSLQSLAPFAPLPCPRPSRLGFSRHLTRHMAICSLRLRFACTATLRTTGYPGISLDNLLCLLLSFNNP